MTDINADLTTSVTLSLTFPCNEAFKEHITKLIQDEDFDPLYEVFDGAIATYLERFGRDEVDEYGMSKLVYVSPDIRLATE